MVPGLDAAADLIREAVPRLMAVYLYGSLANGQANDSSDCDLAILAEIPVDGKSLWDLKWRLAEALGREVDLVDLRSVPTVLAMQVVSGGTVVFDRTPFERGVFEDLVFSSYARLNEERAAILAEITERGSVYG